MAERESIGEYLPTSTLYDTIAIGISKGFRVYT